MALCVRQREKEHKHCGNHHFPKSCRQDNAKETHHSKSQFTRVFIFPWHVINHSVSHNYRLVQKNIKNINWKFVVSFHYYNIRQVLFGESDISIFHGRKVQGKTLKAKRRKHSVIRHLKEVAAICNILIVFKSHCPLEQTKLQQVKSHNHQK